MYREYENTINRNMSLYPAIIQPIIYLKIKRCKNKNIVC